MESPSPLTSNNQGDRLVPGLPALSWPRLHPDILHAPDHLHPPHDVLAEAAEPGVLVTIFVQNCPTFSIHFLLTKAQTECCHFYLNSLIFFWESQLIVPEIAISMFLCLFFLFSADSRLCFNVVVNKSLLSSTLQFINCDKVTQAGWEEGCQAQPFLPSCHHSPSLSFTVTEISGLFECHAVSNSNYFIISS